MTNKNAWAFEGKVALVTGAGSGLGREVARTLAQEKARVIAVDSASDQLLTLDDELRAHDVHLVLAPIDLQDSKKIFSLVGGIYERFGKLDILYGGAATLGALSPIALSESAAIERILQTNLMANIDLLRACHPLLLRSEAARGLWISCDLGKDKPYWGYYHASKVALETIIKAYAIEQKQTAMRMNILKAPRMDTSLYRQAFPGSTGMQNHQQFSSPQKESAPEVIAPPFEAIVQKILFSLSLQENRHGVIIDFSRNVD